MPTPAEAIAYIGVGSNLGNRLGYIREALEALDAADGCTLRRTSPWYESTAVAPGPQPDYLNGVVELATTRAPHKLMEMLLAIERNNGRTRDVRWAARTLDLDLLLYADLCISSTRLQVPHPRMAERNFVVYPLFDVAPDLVLPDGTSLAALRARLGTNGLRRYEIQQDSICA